ncbi:MAG: hypothetical protein KC978_23850, partial [Candidatus Omnitrophica bacterium]|nr:hypothetical protein [Candidatus Omnitrophota bacterium]
MKKETTKSVSEVFVSPSNLSVCSIGMVVVFCAALLLHTVLRVLSPESVVAQEESSVPDSDWTAEMQAVQGKLPSQSHAMRDVAYHFANLWFAAQAGNWLLADFYLNETKSHLHWAVRIIPIRKDLQGEDVDLGGILESVENTQLAWMEEAVANHDKNR